MKTSYDPEVDALTIIIQEGDLDHGEDIGDGIIIHFNRDHVPVEIEILQAKKRLADWVQMALTSPSQEVKAS